MIQQILFYLFSAVLVAAAVGVIASRNPVYSALYLVLAFVQSAALWLLIEAEFLSIVLVLVYVGAVMVLFLFVVMMLDINVEEMRKGFTRYVWLGAVVGIGVIAEIGYVLWSRVEGRQFVTVPQPSPEGLSNATELGAAISRGLGDPVLARKVVAELVDEGVIHLIPVDARLAERAAAIAIDHRIRGCDAVYVALAEALGEALVTFVQRQYPAALPRLRVGWDDARVPPIWGPEILTHDTGIR